VSIAAVEPCSVAVAWSGSSSLAPCAAVYDCYHGSCRCIALSSLSDTLRTL
jgi:hypothetical protein